MKALLKVAMVATTVLLPLAAAQAQSQGSDEAANYGLSWRAARGGYGSAYAYGGYGRQYLRRNWR